MKFSFIITLLLIISSLLISAGGNAKDTPQKTASSSDNKFIITHKPTPNTLVIQDSKTLSQLKLIPVSDIKGNSSDISGIHNASARNSFIVALKNSPEVWEINYENPPPAGFCTWVHDYRKDSGEATAKLFPIRRLRPGTILDNFFFDNDYVFIISVSCKGKIQIIDLDLGRKVANFNIFDKSLDSFRQDEIMGLDQESIHKILLKATQFRLENCSQGTIK